MIKNETREICGMTVSVIQLPAMRAYKVFTRLGRILGPSLAHLGSLDLDPDGEIEDMDFEELAPAIGSLLTGLADDTDLVKALLESTTVTPAGGAPILLSDVAQIDAAFTGEFKAMLLTIKFTIGVNFSDFLGDLLAKAASKKEPKEKAE